MRVFKFRALLTLDPPAPGEDARQYPSGTHSLMIHVQHVGDLPCDKCLPATISCDVAQPVLQGERRVVTLAVADDDALVYLAPGQAFTTWGACAGHGLISRRVFTDGEPS
ncbi:MAG TPA: hypothetical protein VFQ44_29695 [Streptosporangiaceae bacterium]|nr:hypothetical protein [Streptosporangiaceae bacterium]